MFRAVSISLFLLLAATFVVAQPAAQKIVDTEHAFARRALEVGNGPAFVEFMADDAWAFVPDATKAKPFWLADKPDGSILEWAPNFADASMDGSFGYTTGNWQLRPKVGADPTAFGEFNTIWMRQTDGTYKWLIDIGTGHPKPSEYSTKFTTVSVTGGSKPSDPVPSMVKFNKIASSKGTEAAYAEFASDKIRMIRKGKLPILGADAKKELSGAMTFGDNMELKRATDMAFALRPYTFGAEKGTELQVWKYEQASRKWKIVLDVLKPGSGK